jgi:hypothetical protein
MRLEKSAMVTVLRDEPEFSALFIWYLLTRNIRIEEDLVDHRFNSSEQRLARLLLRLANIGKEGKPETLIPKMSQETLAEMSARRGRASAFSSTNSASSGSSSTKRCERPQLAAERGPPRLTGKSSRRQRAPRHKFFQEVCNFDQTPVRGLVHRSLTG